MRAEMPRELNGQPADRASPAMHQHPHAGPQLCGFHQADPGANAGVDQRRPLVEAKVARQRRDALAIAHDRLRIGPGFDVLSDNANRRADRL
jgi:hypothetical protein